MFGRAPRATAHYIRGQLSRRTQPRWTNTQHRFQSTSSGPRSTENNAALIGGFAGGTMALAGVYAWYNLSGTKKIITTFNQTQSYADQVKQGIIKNAPEPEKALDWLRDTVKSYVGFIPGARGPIDKAFDDLDRIKSKHGSEVDRIVRDAYLEMKQLSKKGGATADTAFEALKILQKHLNRIMELSDDVADDILDNHPQLKDKIGGSFDRLKQMGDAYGPRAKEEVNKTWEQITGIVKGGVGAGSVDEIGRLIQDKTDELQKVGQEMWQKGMEESKQYLDRNPKVKELVEGNADALKKGNFSELWGLIKDSASSGKTGDIEKYVKDKVNQAKDMKPINVDEWASLVPGGSKILSQLQSLQTLGEEKGKEAEAVLQETMEEMQDILVRKKRQLEEIARNTKEDSN